MADEHPSIERQWGVVATPSPELVKLANDIVRKINVHDELVAVVEALAKQYEDMGLDTETLRDLITRAEGHS